MQSHAHKHTIIQINTHIQSNTMRAHTQEYTQSHTQTHRHTKPQTHRHTDTQRHRATDTQETSQCENEPCLVLSPSLSVSLPLCLSFPPSLSLSVCDSVSPAEC